MTSVTSWPGVPAGLAPHLERLLGLATVGGSAPGEIFAAIARAREGDLESWVKEFFDLAARLEGEAEASWRRGHRHTAASDLRRATSYFRFAERGADPEAPFVSRFATRRRAAFDRFLEVAGFGWEERSGTGGAGFEARSFGTTEVRGARAPLTILAASTDVLEDAFAAPGVIALGRGHEVTIITAPGGLAGATKSLEALPGPSPRSGTEPDPGRGAPEGPPSAQDRSRPILVALEDAAGLALSLATSRLPTGSPAGGSSPSRVHASSSFQERGRTVSWAGPDEPAPAALDAGPALVFDSPRLPAEVADRDALLALASGLVAPALVLAGEADSARGMQDAKALFGALAGPKQLHFCETELGAGSPRQAGNPLHGANVLLDWIDRLSA